MKAGQHEEASTAPSPCSAEVGGRGTRIQEHADGGVSGLSISGECYRFLFLLILESSQASSEKARAGSHTVPSRSGYA